LEQKKMALEKQTVVDLIEVLENGTVQVRTATRIIEDGVALSSSLHRHVVAPGDDYSQEDAKVQAICAAIQTPDVIAAYQAAIEAAQPVALEE
jgi:S-adenosylmethionine:tRNA-ribosyltransferase-isomerase (queuine synthetase)